MAIAPLSPPPPRGTEIAQGEKTPANIQYYGWFIKLQKVINALIAAGSGGGGVTTVSLNDTSATPIYTTAPTAPTAGAVAETLTLNTQIANTVFSGPSTGAAAQPTFRALTALDLPAGAVPGTIRDLVFWFESDNILGNVATNITGAAPITKLQDKIPWVGGASAIVDPTINPSAVFASNLTLNGLPTLKFPAAQASGAFKLQPSINFLVGVTIFVVANAASSAGGQALLGGSTNCVALYLANGTPALALVKGSTAVIGTCSTVYTVGTFFQANVTYTTASGGFAFRQSRAAANTGLGAVGAGSALTNWIGADGALTAPVAELNSTSVAALIIYNRVLSAAEIISVENYLFAKWGV